MLRSKSQGNGFSHSKQLNDVVFVVVVVLVVVIVVSSSRNIFNFFSLKKLLFTMLQLCHKLRCSLQCQQCINTCVCVCALQFGFDSRIVSATQFKLH